MKGLMLVAVFAAMGVTTNVLADDEVWPKLNAGEVKTVDDVSQVPPLAREAAGLSADAVISHKISFTFFKAPHGRELLIIDPCCGASGNGTSLFEYSEAVVKPVALSVGDPREGFIAQAYAEIIHVEPGAKTLRARIAFGDCEDGVWSYYYRFDEADRPVLLSVIDTSCGHLGVRELYRAKNSDLGHWWQK
ncbi:MAG: hypothetical protein ABJA10_01785 [Aestuariivirga sp.]